MHGLLQMLTFVSDECGQRSRTPPRPGLVRSTQTGHGGQVLLSSLQLLVLHVSDSVLVRPVCRNKISEDIPSYIKAKGTQFLTTHSQVVSPVQYLFFKRITSVCFLIF